MFLKPLSLVLSLAGFATAMTILPQSSIAQSANQLTFFCGTSSGRPATMVRNNRKKTAEVIISWTDNSFPPPWTPQERCEKVSARFQQFYDQKTLEYLKAGKLNGQNVLCVATTIGGPCLPNGVLVTLKPDTDPQRTMQRLRNSQGRADGRPVELSGGNDGIVYKNGEAYLDMRQFFPDEDNGRRW
ncbi:hypothetical protein BCD67_16970 [Oscillatoriales cyanobacterium USR001]|nr:hypothetical protein BCD67_16970 [Oscillatoriales cyanobacterium USR001]